MPSLNDPIDQAFPEEAAPASSDIRDPIDQAFSQQHPQEITYDAAEFKRRIGRSPTQPELENFAANKGVGWAGDLGVVSNQGPMDVVADRLLGGAVRGVIGGYKGITSLIRGQGAEKAAEAVTDITSKEGQAAPGAGEVTSKAISSPYNPLNYIDEAGEFIGNKASEAGAPPAVSTALRILPDTAASLLGVRGMRRGAQPPTMAEPPVTNTGPHPLQGAVDTAADKFTATRQAGIRAGLQLPDRPLSSQVVNSNGMIQDELNLPRQTSNGSPAPITKSVLQAARNRVAGPAYDTVREVPEFNVSDPYEAAIKGLDLEKINPDMRPPGVNGTMSGDQAVDLSRELRAKASKLYAAAKQGHPELEDVAEVHRAAAEAVEDEVSRHLAPGAIQAWDDARTYVAKTYNVEGALDGAGNVVVPKLKAQMLKGKPLSGNIETLATLGATNPEAFATRPTAPPGPGLLRRGVAAAIPIATTATGAKLAGPVGAIAGRAVGEHLAEKVLPP